MKIPNVGAYFGIWKADKPTKEVSILYQDNSIFSGELRD